MNNYHIGGIYRDSLPIPWKSLKNPILIKIKLDRRAVEHDGYCSEPGEDVGEWEYDVEETYQLYEDQLNFLKDNDYIDQNTVDSAYLKTLNSNRLGCQCGSNYCGYEGEARIKEGQLIHCDKCNEFMTKYHKFCSDCNKCVADFIHKHCDHCDIYDKSHKHCDKCDTCVYSGFHKHCGYYIRKGEKCDIIDYWHTHCTKRCGFTGKSHREMENHNCTK